jgi:UDP-GlcNAc:undecaprenyl-phosphate/decaprenyl-phosphate GlcNAc-1-phosphate transferase
MAGVTVAFVVTVLVGLAAVRLGPRIGFLDVPDEGPLKAHVRAAVPLGGAAVFAGLHTGMIVAGRFDPWLLLSSTLLVALGLVDDRRGLDPVPRLVAQVGVAVLFAVGAYGPRGLFWVLLVGALVVVSVNAVNLFDGLDGLAGSAALIACLGISAVGSIRETGGGAALYLAAALVAFLLFNWHPARLFLGDHGAYVVGISLTASIAETSGDTVGLLTAVGVMGVFLVDLAATVFRRWRAGSRLFLGDRNHTYDRLMSRGLGVQTVVLTAATAQLLFAAGVVGLEASVPGVVALGGICLLGLIAVGVAVALPGAGGAPSHREP